MAEKSPATPHRYLYGSGARPLDGYTIKRAIGRGGFGEVYYATSDSGKEVALKLITRNVEVERRGVAQCMNLKCPNLLMIHDIRSNDAGETFVVMEYVAGPSLASVLEDSPHGLPVAEARAWMKGLVEGVSYLHDHGVVHRDLKPANLFLEEGIVKIGDYGLAKIISPQQGSEHSESIGTCHYMAPEISTGKYGKAIDIYAMGVILFEMLTGRVPFDGETVGEVLMKHLTSRPDLSRLAEPYKTIVGQALAKEPANRPKRASDLLLPDDAPPARPARPPDAPKAPDRPDRKAAWGWGRRPSPAPASPPDAPKPEEEVLRIGEQDPVFYIGPETRTPRPGAAGPPRRRGFIAPIRWVNEPGPGQAQRQDPGGQRQQQRQRRVQAPAPVPLPPPTPPARPGLRVRAAELSGSMVWAALLSALMTVPLATALEIDRAGGDHRNAILLFAMTLATSWAGLLAAKPLEGTGVKPLARRSLGLALGVGVGLVGAALASLFGVGFGPRPDAIGLVDLGPPAALPVGLAALFGLGMFANGWWKLADRDRPGRVRIVPLGASALISAALAGLFPFHQGWIAAALPTAALVVQLVSPWSRQAAAYAAYVRAARIKEAVAA